MPDCPVDGGKCIYCDGQIHGNLCANWEPSEDEDDGVPRVPGIRRFSCYICKEPTADTSSSDEGVEFLALKSSSKEKSSDLSSSSDEDTEIKSVQEKLPASRKSASDSCSKEVSSKKKKKKKTSDEDAGIKSVLKKRPASRKSASNSSGKKKKGSRSNTPMSAFDSAATKLWIFL